MSNELADLESAARNAGLAGAFDEMQDALDRYGALVARQFLDRSLPADGARTLMDRTEQLFDWASAMLLASREQCAADLARMQKLGRYNRSSA